MATVSVLGEFGAQTPLQSTLGAGVDALDRQQVIQFRQYRRTVLPIDGYVFWVLAGQTINVRGSLHYSSDVEQDDDQTIGVNRLLFTTRDEIAEFNEASPDTMFIGDHRGIKVAFSGRGMRAPEAGIWHYFGNAIYPPFFSQIIDDPADLENVEPIVSNSLPIWLSLTAFGPVYPAYLVDPNITPPYIAVDIDSETTDEWQSLPSYDAGDSYAGGDISLGVPDQSIPGAFFPTASQLVHERVRFILYGFNNQQALSYRSYVLENSLNGDIWGVSEVSPIRDEKRIQREIAAIAMKKTFSMSVNYLQSAVVQISERLIKSASISLTEESL
jgi:hypothetical protein